MNSIESEFRAKAEKHLSKKQLSLIMGFFRTVMEPATAEVRQAKLTLKNNQHIVNQLALACKQRDDMAAVMAEVNEYCQQNKIGGIGESACLALLRDHKVLKSTLLDLADAVLTNQADAQVRASAVIKTLRP